MKWINIKDSLPMHMQNVLITDGNQYCVVKFIDSKCMNESLIKKGYLEELTDITKSPYFFASQEIRGDFLVNTTHWMSLPDLPLD